MFASYEQSWQILREGIGKAFGKACREMLESVWQETRVALVGPTATGTLNALSILLVYKHTSNISSL
jgi:hypothetical protein